MLLHTVGGNKFFDEQLLFDIRNGNNENVLAILENVDVKKLVDSAGMTLLHHAVDAGNKMTAVYLIKRGCEVDVLDANGNTPLIHALVRCNNWPVISLLLNSNADILLCGEGKNNPLEMILAPESLFYNNVGTICAEFLEMLKRKFSADSQQIARILLEVKCPFPRTMFLRDPVVTEYMLNGGCTVHDREPHNDFTALHYAIMEMDVNNVKLLLEHGADIRAKDKAGYTPSDFYTAGEEESYEMLITLLNNDATLNASTGDGYELAESVFEDGQIDEVEAMLRYDFNFEDSSWNSYRRTLLHCIAVNKNRGVTMEKLEGRKFDVNARDIDGRTALWDTAYHNNPSSFEFLLKHGADPNSKDEDGKTAFYYCFKEWVSSDSEHLTKNEIKSVELLLEYGADVQSDRNTGGTIFDIPLNDHMFALIRPIIAKVAMLEATGKYIIEDILQVVRNNKRYEKFFNICKCKIKKLQKTKIHESVRLFQFLTESEEKLLGYVRNHKVAERLEQVISAKRRSKIFFVKLLRKRIQSILKTAKLREEAASSMIKMSGCGNRDVIDIIVLLLDKQSLKNVCQAA